MLYDRHARRAAVGPEAGFPISGHCTGLHVSEDEKLFVLNHFQESTSATQGPDGAFFTPHGLAHDMAIEVVGTRIIDLGLRLRFILCCTLDFSDLASLLSHPRLLSVRW
ncbi:hypothetical protein AB0M45_31185 [Nocardia sp. NPDC051787]|uniref:hypothetical protein n=1 Tax=Nocardia sp. NPDC051787 TaxID=3155415 RepID=UPI003421FC23